MLTLMYIYCILFTPEDCVGWFTDTGGKTCGD